MKYFVCSDLHLEFHKDKSKIIDSLPESDAIILAGDTSVADSSWVGFMPRIAKKYKHVLLIGGNHDYYHGDQDSMRFMMNHLPLGCQNVHYLEDSTIELDGQRFIASTLWFERNSGSSCLLNDFNYIRKFTEWVFDVNEYSLNYLSENVREDDVVITHHLPSYQSVARFYKNSDLNGFFVSPSAEQVIKENQPKLWIHGHTHTNCDYYIGKTRVLCNPYGYPKEHRYFRTDLILEW